MEIDVTRLSFSDKSTQGEIDIDGQFFCFTLELPKKDGLPGSCVPPGRYRVATYPSPKFGRLMPLIEDIPGRSQIEIHFGNTPSETNGCILLGYEKGQDFVGNSRKAFDDFWIQVQGPAERGEAFITIRKANLEKEKE